MRQWAESVTTGSVGAAPGMIDSLGVETGNVADRCPWFHDQKTWTESGLSAFKFLSGDVIGKDTFEPFFSQK